MRTAALLAVAALAGGACGSSAPPVGPSNKAPAPSYEASLDDALGFLPADSEIVVGIEAAQIRKTAIWAQLGPELEKLLGSDLAEVKTACGFDPLQTVERVSIGLRAQEQERLAGVVVIRGVGAGTMGCVRTRFGKGGEVTDDKGVLILGHHDDRVRSAWTVIGSTLIVQIDRQVSHDSLQQVLAVGSPLRSSHAFMEIHSRLERGASMWAVVNGKTRLLDDLTSMGVRPVSVAGTLTMTDRIVIAGRAVFGDADTAIKVDGMVKPTLVQIAKLTEHGESRVEGNAVIVGLAMTGAQLSQLLGMF